MLHLPAWQDEDEKIFTNANIYLLAIGLASGMSACHSILGIEDLPPLADEDVPYKEHLDLNGDGIDGNAADAYFVHPDGSDGNPGTMLEPFATIQHAIDRASQDPQRWQVLVAHGMYPEAISLPDGVSVFGQYDDTWQRSSSNTTISVRHCTSP